MNIEEIVKFKNSLNNLTLDELNKKKAEFQDRIAKMIMDSDLTMQIAILEAKNSLSSKTKKWRSSIWIRMNG